MMDSVCDICSEAQGSEACRSCIWGNPCLSCEDYDYGEDTCRSNGGCGKQEAKTE